MKKTLYIFLSLIFSLSVSSCTDDFPLGDYEIGEGEAVLSATVNFHPLVGTKVDTGQGGRAAAGDALNDIDNITVFVYKEDGHLFDIYNGADLMDLKTMRKDTEGANTEMPSDAGEKAEETTSRATFTLKGIPFGKYNIYVTANIPFDKKQAKIDFENVKDLKKYTVEWNEKNIADNDQMFGYFSETGESDGFDAYPVVVNKKQMEIHAWIKRAASKVTVVFDGSGLHNGVFIYVKDVRIKDIPKYCRIGEDNRVWTEKGSQDSLINEGDVIYYNTDGLTETDPGEDYLKWLQINKGNGLRGAVSKDPETGVVTEHSEYDKALYFYENIQGNYPGQKEYCKHQDWDKVGYMPKPGEDDYKDNIPYGTYIEVEAYYVSENPENVSHGKIIYRFMLGQDVDYNYNAIRNHHYKLTLGFKGWANQPDWHIAYIEQDPTIFTDPTYYVSYMYNQKAIFPIRIIGDVQEFEVEIVENNWAPYDEKTGVPDATVGTGVDAFKWNKEVYENKAANRPSGGFYYGLQTPWTTDGKTQKAYDENEIKKGAPEKVTPIWAGFLALNVPGNTPEDLEAMILQREKGDWYSTGYENLKKSFYGTGPYNYPKDGNDKDYNGGRIQQNIRKFTAENLKFPQSNEPQSKEVGSGNNKCTINKELDGSITILFPMWTRPKSMLYISGFTGNNPYDTYQRKAMVKLTAKYADGKKITKYRPVYQVRRVVNPKAVWRQWNDNDVFTVKLNRREGAAATTFSTVESEGAWKAYVKKFSPGADGFITLSGGDSKEGDAIIGNTGSKIQFDINFQSKGEAGKSLCAIVEIEYHGFTCKHSIFVRQGYYTPLAIVDNGAKWSSFSLFSCDKSTPYQTEWDGKSYIDAVVTATPLALGTLFKRGNYAQGILVKNNKTKGPLATIGSYKFELAPEGSATWSEISGISYSTSGIEKTFAWSRFKAKVNGEDRYYRVPTYEDYNALLQGDYGLGVLYADGASSTADNVSVAYGFEDVDNDNNKDDSEMRKRGMRGLIVFNPANAHQIFFPLGARGIGRRTIANTNGNPGVLRYGALPYELSYANGKHNQYRPIPYNLPASPGAIYWIEKVPNIAAYLAWDMNYFDFNFNGYDNAVSLSGGGDALPIKLVLDESASSN